MSGRGGKYLSCVFWFILFKKQVNGLTKLHRHLPSVAKDISSSKGLLCLIKSPLVEPSLTVLNGPKAFKKANLGTHNACRSS